MLLFPLSQCSLLLQCVSSVCEHPTILEEAVYMRVCACVCTRVGVCVNVGASVVSVRVRVCVEVYLKCVCVSVCLRTCVMLCMCALWCLRVCGCTYLPLCIYGVFVYMCVCMCVRVPVCCVCVRMCASAVVCLWSVRMCVSVCVYFRVCVEFNQSHRRVFSRHEWLIHWRVRQDRVDPRESHSRRAWVSQ